jgi:hypothetical protein
VLSTLVLITVPREVLGKTFVHLTALTISVGFATVLLNALQKSSLQNTRIKNTLEDKCELD